MKAPQARRTPTTLPPTRNLNEGILQAGDNSNFGGGFSAAIYTDFDCYDNAIFYRDRIKVRHSEFEKKANQFSMKFNALGIERDDEGHESGGMPQAPIWLDNVNSFANVLAKTLQRYGKRAASVFAHVTSRHVTENSDSYQFGRQMCLFGGAKWQSLRQKQLEYFRQNGMTRGLDSAEKECPEYNGGMHIFYSLYTEDFYHEAFREMENEYYKFIAEDVEKHFKHINIVYSKSDILKTTSEIFEELPLGKYRNTVKNQTARTALQELAWVHYNGCVNDRIEVVLKHKADHVLTPSFPNCPCYVEDPDTKEHTDVGLIMFKSIPRARLILKKDWKNWIGRHWRKTLIDLTYEDVHHLVINTGSGSVGT